MSAARKPVIVRKLTRDWCAGYAAANSVEESTELELLDLSGKFVRIRWDQIKWVCYVRELVEGAARGLSRLSGEDAPERLLRRRFASRPRIPGLWLRLTFPDGEELEGVAGNDRSLVEGAGLLLTPPDTRSNTQRVFVPRTAIRELTVLAVISPAGAGRRDTPQQPGLFVVGPNGDPEGEGSN